MQAIQEATKEERIDTPYLTVKEASRYCRVATTTLWRNRKRGELKASGPGATVLFHKDDLDAWMRSRTRP